MIFFNLWSWRHFFVKITNWLEQMPREPPLIACFDSFSGLQEVLGQSVFCSKMVWGNPLRRTTRGEGRNQTNLPENGKDRTYTRRMKCPVPRGTSDVTKNFSQRHIRSTSFDPIHRQRNSDERWLTYSCDCCECKEEWVIEVPFLAFHVIFLKQLVN